MLIKPGTDTLLCSYHLHSREFLSGPVLFPFFSSVRASLSFQVVRVSIPPDFVIRD